MQIESIILSRKSATSVRLDRLVSNLKTFLLRVFQFIRKILSFAGVKISNWIDTFYWMIHPKIVAKKKLIFNILSIFNVLVLVALGIVYIILKEFHFKYLIYLGLLDGNILVYYLLFKLYHFLFGRFSIDTKEEYYSREFTKHVLINIAKIYGRTGAGKDESEKGFLRVKREMFVEDIKARMSRIREYAYLFDFDLLDKIAVEKCKLFFSSSEKKTKNNFLKLCKQYNYFLKDYYLDKINQDELLEDLKKYTADKVNYSSKFMFNSGGINKEHFLIMAYDYIWLYVRVNIEKNMIFSNQPVIEDPETGLMAKVFSQNYTVTKHQSDTSVKVEETEFGTKGNIDYIEKIEFPLKDYLMFSESETGTVYLNLDREITAMLAKLGIRDFKAFNRHFFPHFVWYQIDQDGDRVSKLMEELDHGYIRIDRRVEVDGGIKKNMVLGLAIKIINFITKKSLNTVNKYNYKTVIKQNKIGYYQDLYNATSNRKYHEKVTALNSLTQKQPSAFIEKMLVWRKILAEKIEYNKYKDGYIIKDITVSKMITTETPEIKTPLALLKNPELANHTYSVRLYQKKSDCWIYDTHYMKAAKEHRAFQSELDLVDAPSWNRSMNMTKKEIKVMGYDATFNIYGLSEEEKIQSRYKKKEIKGPF